MPTDPRLMALPALRRLAEEEARDIWDRHVRLFRDVGWDVTERPTLTPVDGDEPREVSDAYEITVVAQLERLADLTRPASRDAVARVVAEAVGLECGATAPDIGRYACGEHCCDGQNGRMVPCVRPIWSMMGADETRMAVFADCPDPEEWDGEGRRHVPGISAVTDPAEALTMIAMAVLADSPHKPVARPPVDSSGRTCHDPGHVNMWHCGTCDAGVAAAPAMRVEPAADLQDDDGEWIHDPDMGAR